jgi:putative transposase
MTPAELELYEQLRYRAIQLFRQRHQNPAALKDILSPLLAELLQAAQRPDTPQNAMSGQPSYPTSLETTHPIRLLKQPMNGEVSTTMRWGSDKVTPAGWPPRRSLNHWLPRKPTLDPDDIWRWLGDDTRTNGMILNLFEQGLSYLQIQAKLIGMYVHLDEIEAITDQLLPRANAWCERVLQPIYTYVWITEVPFQVVRQGRLTNCRLYSVVGIDIAGRQEVIGLYLGERGERLWPELLRDLKQRGVEDVLILCTDNSPAVVEAVRAELPNTHLHRYGMLQLRTSLHLVTGPDQLKLTRELTAVLSQPSRAAADQVWEKFKRKWAERYPVVIEMWEHEWAALTEPMNYVPIVSEMAQKNKFECHLYDELHRLSREQVTYNSGSDLLKRVFMVSESAGVKLGSADIRWGLALQQLALLFGDRVKKYMVM